MTDEYRAFLESRKSEESDHPVDIPRWKPSEKKETETVIQHSDGEEIPHWKPTKEKPVKENYEGFNFGDYLAHHGIKGQKWGVRRFQDKDGHRIGAEKKTKSSGSDSEESEGAPKKERFNSKTLSYKAKPQHLTDEELARRNRRMQMEAQYNQLRSQLQPKTKAQRRKEIRNQIFVATMTTAAAAIMTTIYKKAATWMIKKASGGKIDLGSKKK